MILICWNNIMLNIYPFSLQFTALGPEKIQAAVFTFIADSVPVEGINCLVTSRDAGNMAHIESLPVINDKTGGELNSSRLRLFAALGINPACVIYLNQIHSRTIAEADSRRLCRGAEADGIVTCDRSIFLSVTVADCLPVFLYDAKGGSFALVHSGWKGTGIARNALQLLIKNHGARPENIAAVLGPCIRSCCYNVDEERARAFEEEFGVGFGDDLDSGHPGSVPFTEPAAIHREGSHYLDLQAANIRLLASAGVHDIAVCENCTFTDLQLGSFRREGPSFTRMIAMLGDF